MSEFIEADGPLVASLRAELADMTRQRDGLQVRYDLARNRAHEADARVQMLQAERAGIQDNFHELQARNREIYTALRDSRELLDYARQDIMGRTPDYDMRARILRFLDNSPSAKAGVTGA
jgi:hypothetical protein